MLSSALHDHQIAVPTAPGLERTQYRLWLKAVYAVVVGTLLFNFVLAFVNTNVFRISESHVILSEMALLAVALFLIFSRNTLLLLILLLYFSYMALILTLRPELDLKAIRDFLIPIVFYLIGRNFRQIEDADRLVWISALVVLSVLIRGKGLVGDANDAQIADLKGRDPAVDGNKGSTGHPSCRGAVYVEPERRTNCC